MINEKNSEKVKIKYEVKSTTDGLFLSAAVLSSLYLLGICFPVPSM